MSGCWRVSFEVERREDVLKIPNSALRFFPQPQHVRTEDKPLLEGRRDEAAPGPPIQSPATRSLPLQEVCRAA